MPTNLPGGRILAGIGGYLNVVSPYNGNMTRFNVASWDLFPEQRLFRKGSSGSVMGAILSRVTALDWHLEIRVWWDLSNPPENLLLGGWGCGLQLGIGSKAGQATYNPTGQTKFYLAPSGMTGPMHIRDSSEGQPDDVVTADIQIFGNAPVFLLPDSMADYEAWLALVTANGEYNGLANLTTFQQGRAMPSNMPGGPLLKGIGGYLELWNWKAPQSQPNYPPIPTAFRAYDVARWKINGQQIYQPLWYSGCAGSMRRRGVITDWSADLLVWWDFLNPPEKTLLVGDALAVKFTLGSYSTWTGLPLDDLRPGDFNTNPPDIANIFKPPVASNGILDPAGDLWIPCYVSPVACWTDYEQNDSSEPDENGIVWQKIHLAGDSNLWYLTSALVESHYNSYVTTIANRNMIAYQP